MEQLFLYLIKSSGLLIVFFLTYHFLLRKETFFSSNRWFLLSGLITSVTLPLFFIEKIIFIEKPKLSVDDFLVMGNHTTNTAIVEQVEPINWLELAAIGYGLLVGFFLIRVLINIISFYKLLHNKKIEKYEAFSIVDLNEDIAPFSFFNFIVFNSSLYSSEELQNILLHEKVHCQQKHSLDVLLANLFTIVFWFNPFIWLYKKAIIQNLEFIADNQAIQLIEDKKAYQKALLKVVSHQNCLPITNNFYQSLIKKRIVMLNKNQSNRSNSWKYSVVIPALVAFVLLFQIKVVAQEKEVSDVQKAIRDSKDVSIALDSNDPDEGYYSLTNEFKRQHVITKISNIKRDANNKIIAINILMTSDDGRKQELNINRTLPIKAILLFAKMENDVWNFGAKEIESIDHPDSLYSIDEKSFNEVNIRSEKKSNSSQNLAYIVDKISTDKELNDMISELKKLDIILTISNLKRNKNNEIIAVKLNFKDKNGHKGTTQQKREIPIRPIFFKVSDELNGFESIGFYDNSELENKPYNKILDNKISTIETISNDALIYVDGKRYNKEFLNELDPKGLEKIEILNDAKSLEQYGAKDKKEVILITTNWTTKPAVPLSNTPSIFTLENGNEVVLFNRFNMKIPEYPSVTFTDNSPILILNGIQQNNPRLIIESIDVTKIKTIKALNENDKEVKGTPIYKLIINTK